MRTAIVSCVLMVLATASAQVKVYPPDAPKAGKASVAVRSLSEVSGPKVLLKDVAEITAVGETKAKLEQIDLGAAPVAGIPRPIVFSRVQAGLLAAGFRANDVAISVPPDAKVALKVQKITNQQFIDVAKKAVASQLGMDIPLNCSQNYPDFPAPNGQLSLEPGQVNKNQNGFSVLIAVNVEGKRFNSRIVNLTVDPSVAATAIKSGDAVKIVLKSAGATIEVSGKAKSGGYLGQQIAVISSTGSTHTGIVVGPGQVEVKL
jgi:hypothetical protein